MGCRPPAHLAAASTPAWVRAIPEPYPMSPRTEGWHHITPLLKPHPVPLTELKIKLQALPRGLRIWLLPASPHLCPLRPLNQGLPSPGFLLLVLRCQLQWHLDLTSSGLECLTHLKFLGANTLSVIIPLVMKDKGGSGHFSQVKIPFCEISPEEEAGT